MVTALAFEDSSSSLLVLVMYVAPQFLQGLLDVGQEAISVFSIPSSR